VRWWIGIFVVGVIVHFWLALATDDPMWIERGGGFSAIVGAAGAAAALLLNRRFERATRQLGDLADLVGDEQRETLRAKMAGANDRYQTLLILVAALSSAEQAYADWLFAMAKAVTGG
jgi:hypothetical protein